MNVEDRVSFSAIKIFILDEEEIGNNLDRLDWTDWRTKTDLNMRKQEVVGAWRNVR